VDVPLQIGFAPGRTSSAVVAQPIRRMMREVYRVNQHVLIDLSAFTGGVLTLMVLYRGKEDSATDCIPADLVSAMRKLAERLRPKAGPRGNCRLIAARYLAIFSTPQAPSRPFTAALESTRKSVDRNAAVGTVLIFVILMVWMWMLTPPPPHTEGAGQDAPVTDTAGGRAAAPAPAARARPTHPRGIAGRRRYVLAAATEGRGPLDRSRDGSLPRRLLDAGWDAAIVPAEGVSEVRPGDAGRNGGYHACRGTRDTLHDSDESSRRYARVPLSNPIRTWT
jgi:hypothetical protein